MKKILNNDSLSLLGLFSVITFLFFITACTRPENEVGLDIQPEGDVLYTYYTDTVTLVTSGVRMDSLKSSGTSSVILGNYYDHVFGHTRASIFTQLRLSTNGIPVPDAYEIDSVVMALAYTGRVYGKNVPQYYAVYEMTDTLSIHPDSSYYTNSVIGFESNSLVEPGMEWNATDIYENFIDDGDTLTPQLRIHLQNELGERFFTEVDSTANNTIFRQYFEGLHIRSESDDAACLNYDLDNSASRVTIYYRDISGTEPDTLSYVLTFGSLSKKFTSFEHQYTPGDLFKFDSFDTIPGQQKCYVQAGAGMMTKIEFPNLDTYNQYEGRAVNLARLVMPVAAESDEHCCEPQELILLYGVADDGSREILPFDWEVNTFYEAAQNRYRINIAKYVQEVLNGQRNNNGLYLVSAGGAVTVNRVVLNGPEFSSEDPAQNMYLELAFSN